MSQNVTMPYIFMIIELNCIDNNNRIAQRIDVHETWSVSSECTCCINGADSTCREGRVHHALAFWQTKRKLWQYRLERNNNIFQRFHTYGFFPSQLVSIWRTDGAIPADAVDQLYVIQVEVNRMGINTVVSDFPQYRCAVVIKEFSWWIDIAVWNCCLITIVSHWQFDAECCIHTTIRIPQFLNSFGLEGNCYWC